ncbi:YjgF-like protein [Aspergillus ellipticus CBS 707.79]|uniref:YjgF-like protein n=1 Tax=Aspergillus ellipticus CBS 707.79 TaxID=1448320 RepID=A0A319D7E3_9EURO|nr:YjgF-like protein [Aspergillus ellipticus CBS 707.79]
MPSLPSYSRPGRGQHFQDAYGFAEACIAGDRMEIAGQIGMSPTSTSIPPTIEEEVAQAFTNINEVILYTLEQVRPELREKVQTGWDKVVKLRTYHVNLAPTREHIIELMVENVKKWCPGHQPTSTMVGIEALPFEGQNLEVEVDVFLG